MFQKMSKNNLNLLLWKPPSSNPSSSFQTPYKDQSQRTITQENKISKYLLPPSLSLSKNIRELPKFKTPSQSQSILSNGIKRPSSEELKSSSPPKALKRNAIVDDTKNGDDKELVSSDENIEIEFDKDIVLLSEKNSSETGTVALAKGEIDDEEMESPRQDSASGIQSNYVKKTSPMMTSPTAQLGEIPESLKTGDIALIRTLDSTLPATTSSKSDDHESSDILSSPTVANRSANGPKEDFVSKNEDLVSITTGMDSSLPALTPSESQGQLSSRSWEKSVFNLSLDDIVSDYDEESNIKGNSSSDSSINNLSRKFPQLTTESITDEIRAAQEENNDVDGPLDSDAPDSSSLQPVTRADPITSWFGSRRGSVLQSPASSVKSLNISNISDISFDLFRERFKSYSRDLLNSKTESNSLTTSREQEGVIANPSETLLSLFHSTTGLGAAVYYTESAKLKLLRDLPDNCEEFEMLTMLLYETNPDKVLMSARQDQDTVKFVKDMLKDQGAFHDNNQSCVSESGSAVTILPAQVVFKPSREFSFKVGERRLRSISIPGREPESESERDILLSAFIDFNCANMVRAAGALMNYVDKNYRIVGDEEPDVLFLGPLNLKPILSLDAATLTSLQVFSTSSQLSGSTAGSWNKRREGLSVFTLLNRCSSVGGSRFLRHMLRCPSGEKQVIERRQHDLEFFCNTAHNAFSQALCASVKKVKNFQRLIKKISSNSMTVSDWQGIASTLNGIVEIAIHADSCKKEVYVLWNISVSVSEKVFSIRAIVEKMIDFKKSQADGTLRVNPGVDEKLDEKRRLLNGLPDLLSKVVLEETERLPEYLNVCTICYLPHVGYLIAVPSSKQLTENLDYKNIPGLEFVFESNNTIHFRNNRTRLLDTNVGDVVLDITKLETKIITRISEALLRERNSLEKIVASCAHLDSLLALSQVCKERNWVKPSISVGGDIIIKEGRHPLQEMTLNNFIANDTEMGTYGGKVHFLTGPNSSGKSVYMKQVGLIVFLAHIGCFVPASVASIPVLNRINTRITTTESISTGMSAFMCDINQLTFSLTHLRSRSLLLVDEFGKGTAAKDGASLLAATVSILSDMDQAAPFSIFSSHFHSVPALVDSDPQPRFLHMKTEVTEANLLYYFKITEGISRFSHATKVARRAGLEDDIIKRAEVVLDDIVNDDGITENRDLINKKIVSDLMSHLLEMNIENEDEVELFLEQIMNLDI